MKRFAVAAALTVLLGSALVACGGGGGSNGGGGGTSLAAGTFTKTPVDVVSGGWSRFIDTGANAHWQNLYTAGTISASGKITGMAFKYATTMTSAITCTGVTIKMGHTNLAGFTTSFADTAGNGQGGQATVLANGTLTFPAAAADTWQTISFTTPFDYNGKDNLIVDFERPYACSDLFRDAFAFVPNFATAFSFSGGPFNRGAWVQNTRLTFAGGENKVDFASTYNLYGAPLTTTAWGQKVQMLYNAGSIAGSGPITGIALQAASDVTTALSYTYTYTMKVGHSLKTALSTTWTDNFDSGSPVIVANSAPLRVPAGFRAGEFIWLPMPDGIFTYNGVDNLVIELTIEKASGLVELATHTTTSINLIHGDPANAAGVAGNFAYQIALRFNGGKIYAMPTNTSNSSPQVLGSAMAGQVQSLYPNTILGTSGTIQNVYVRLSSLGTPTAATLTNYKLYMGLTSKWSYTTADTYASNMDGMATVYSGTLNVPTGLKVGDWVKIPLTTPFAYDVRKNLSVLFTTDLGPDGNYVTCRNDTAFASYSVGRNDNTVDTSGHPHWSFDGIIDLAIDIAK